MNKKAFTLIELLVVVLIIGILAAIALPQYQRAVMRARLTQLITLANSVVWAEEEYYLANGSYTNEWDDLTLDIPGTVSYNELTSSDGYTLTLRLKGNSTPDSVIATDSRIPGVRLYFGFVNTTYSGWANVRRCYALASDETAQGLCHSATGSNKSNGTSGTGSNESYTYVFK